MKLYFCYHNVTIKYIKSLTKNIFDRERPTLLRLIDISGFSFPSGHAMGSTSFLEVQCILLSVEHRSTKGVIIGLCAALILLISISRVYLGVHYPTDIIAGIIGGAFCIVLSTLVLKGLHEPTTL